MLMQPTRLRFALVLVATAVLLSACGGGGDESSSGSSASGDKGGTYRVGWENSFGFTDNFDPTGEYLGDAQGIHSSLLVRTLVGYDHVAGVAGNKLVPDLATEVPEPTDDGQDLHLQAQGRHQVRPAGQPPDHLEGRALRARAPGGAEERRRSTPSTTR